MSIEYIDKQRFLLENYKKLNLTEKQLIILLLCIVNDVVFRIDYDKLNNIMNITPDDVTNELSQLFQENKLLVTLSKIDGKHVEVIDSTNLFVVNEIANESDNNNLFSEIECSFGKSLNSKEVAVISKWISTNKYSYNDILDAFGIAAINNVKNLNYVAKVLENKTEVNSITPLKMQYNWLEDE
ncbi:MAG: DnaD domain protein [Bacilli bacterium]